MAVVVTDNRTVINEADSTSGWTGSPSLFTTDPAPVESTGSIGYVVSNATVDAFFTTSAIDLTNSLVYIWVRPFGAMDTTANGGVSIHLGDGTNRIAFHIAGSDIAAFQHAQGPVEWQCIVIDTSNLPASFTTRAGSSVNLDISAITQIGATFKTLVKSVGGVSNCFIDIMRYGNEGLTITGGTVGNPGLFEEIAIEDRSTANVKAHGIIRRLGAGLFGLQGRLTFGTSAGSDSTYFADKNTTVVFESRNIADDKYGIIINATSTGSTTFILGTKTSSESGSEGVTITAPIGVGAFFDASNSSLQMLGLYNCILNGMNNGVDFSHDATNGPEHEVFSSTFSSCGMIDIGLVEFKNNTISGSVDSSALKIVSTSGVSNLQFSSGGSGHAILIEDPGTYDFNNFTYSGYASIDGSTGNEVVYNNSGGHVTINVSGGNVPTVRNGAGSTTEVLATVSITLTGMKDNTEVRIYDSGTEIAGIENVVSGDSNDRTFTFSATPDSSIDIITFNLNWISDPIRNFIVPGTNASIPIAQRLDRVYFNPPGP